MVHRCRIHMQSTEGVAPDIDTAAARRKPESTQVYPVAPDARCIPAMKGGA
jgi:hypothetical protein